MTIQADVLAYPADVLAYPADVLTYQADVLDLSENSKARLFKALRQNFDICIKT